MNTFTKGFRIIGQDINQHLPGVLTGIAVVGVVAEAFVMYKKAPKIKLKVEEIKEDYKKVKDEGFKEKAIVVADSAVKLAPDVLPPLIITGLTVACIIGSHKVSARRLAMATSALALTNDKLTAKIAELDEYKKATKELTTTKKSEEINEVVAKKTFSDLDSNDPIIFDDADPDNDCIFMEENSGTVWRDSYLHVVNCINKAYDVVHHSGDNLRLDEFIGILNEERFGGNRIRNHMTNNVWEYSANNYYNCRQIEDFMYIQAAGTTAQGVKQFIIKSNPTLSENVLVGMRFDEATCGDGIWRSA